MAAKHIKKKTATVELPEDVINRGESLVDKVAGYNNSIQKQRSTRSQRYTRSTMRTRNAGFSSHSGKVRSRRI